jgi:catechol 2,3-dioxygenase-like lactoylglutathione lyase family enzyme
MRLRGVNHVDLNVLDFETSVAFYDRMLGWLGYKSFSTLGVGYSAVYYVAPPHSYIGIHSAGPDHGGLDIARHPPSIHHIALWAGSRREVDRFHAQFLVPNGVRVTDEPVEYPIYFPGYYAVFFLDPTGIRWELVHFPMLPGPAQIARSLRAARQLRREHPEWKRHPALEMWRKLPTRSKLSRGAAASGS